VVSQFLYRSLNIINLVKHVIHIRALRPVWVPVRPAEPFRFAQRML
jgi:hypothetical protein